MDQVDRGAVQNDILVELTASIVGSYVANNSTSPDQINGLITQTYSALSTISSGAALQPKEEEVQRPAVAIKKSVTPDFIVCLEDGKKFKSLKRHLATHYNMSPDEYRAKWGLPHDYPMVAPNYAAARSELAKKMGLGQQRSKAVQQKGKTAPKRRARATEAA